jgi:VWFA-related protein
MSRSLAGAAGMMGLVSWLAMSAGAAQRFSTSVDGVAVDVLVTRDGRPVKGLTAADFILRDNGVRQQIDSVMIEDVPITLVLVLDISDSVKGSLLESLMSAVRSAGRALRRDDRVGLMTFSDRVHMILPPPADPGLLNARLDSIEAGGATTLYDATFAAVAFTPQKEGRALVLVFSDGSDTVSALDPRRVLDAARRSDIVVHAVTRRRGFDYPHGEDAVTRRVERQRFAAEPELFGRLFLSQLTEETGGSLFVTDTVGLQQAFARVIDEFRSRYLLTYSPKGVAISGLHSIEITLFGHRGEVRARRGYVR